MVGTTPRSVRAPRGEGSDDGAADPTSPVRWLDPAEARAWRAFLEAALVVLDDLDSQLQRDAGMPHAYYEILVRLSEAPDRALRMRDLAEAASSSRSRLSHAIARLEERGWVRRTVCPTDRRGQIAELTEAGFAALAAAAPEHVAQVRRSVIDRLGRAQLGQLERLGEAILAGRRPGR